MGGGIPRAAVACAALATALALAAPARADLTTLLASAHCALEDAADGDPAGTPDLPFYRCDDGLPPAGSGGISANENGTNAIEVPSAYQGYVGLPAKDPGPSVPGEDSDDNVALDVNVSLPEPALFGAAKPADDRYPLVVFMHGCCDGHTEDWEAETIEGGTSREKWHHSNAWFAARGYVVLSYASRGFVRGNGTPVTVDDQGSTGHMQLQDRAFEINDYQALVAALVDHGDLHPDPGKTVRVAPERIVTVGGSYGGGFAWMTLTDPVWESPGGTTVKLAATTPKYGWTDLAYSLVPNGAHLEDRLVSFSGSDTADPLGRPKRSIVAGLYATGTTGLPTSFNHTTFPPEIDVAHACIQAPDNDPCIETLRDDLLPRFLNGRSAYYQQRFFDGLADGSLEAVPVFSAAALTDPLFPGREHRRMAERLLHVDPNYPITQYYGDFQHFTQNKRKEWSDVCGSERRVCELSDYPGGDLDARPAGLRREGVNTRLNRFVDHYAKPPSNPDEPRPASNVTSSLQICPDNAPLEGIPLDEPGPRFVAADFDALAPNTLTVSRSASATTTNPAVDQHKVQAEPIFNQQTNQDRCATHSGSAGPGVATYDSPALERDYTMIGPTRVTAPYTATTSPIQLNARLYDVLPDGKQVLVDRGVRTLAQASGDAVLDLFGNAWRFRRGHRIRIELTQDDDPFIKPFTQPATATLAGVRLELPVREASAAIGDAPSSAQTEDTRAEPPADEDERPGRPAPQPSANDGPLPFTGFVVAGLLGAGLVLVGLGVALRRRLRGPR